MPGSRSAEIQRLEHQLEELRRTQFRLADSIRDNRSELRRLAGQISTAEINLRHLSSPDPSKAAGTIADAAEACLRRHGRPMRVVEMVPELQEEGKLLRAASAYSTLFRTLSRAKGRFEHVQGRRGYWVPRERP